MKKWIAKLTILSGISLTMGGCPFVPPPAVADQTKFVDLVSEIITTDECLPPVEVNGLDLKFPQRPDAFDDLLAQIGGETAAE